ncbi:choice-of-anchor D domain-containing protein [Candidatus Zixiibacteriota bacterium]
MKRFTVLFVLAVISLVLVAQAPAQIAQRETLYVDDSDGDPFYTETGQPWQSSTGLGWGGTHRYILMDDPNNIDQTARWTPDIITAGHYFVSFYLPPTSNSRNHCLYTVTAFGTTPDSSWHDQNFNSGNFIPLGVHFLSMGMNSFVEVVNDSTSTSGYAYRSDATRYILGPDGRDFEPGRRNSYDYGETALLSPKDWVLRIYNIGGADLTINEVTFSTGAFSLFDPTPPVVIPARSYSDFTVRFIPFAEQTFSDLMTIHSDDPDEPAYGFSLSGEGVGQFVLVNNDDGAPGYIEEIGEWSNSNGAAGCPGITNSTSRYAIQSTSPGATATFTPDIPIEGLYRIYFVSPPTANASDNALYVIRPWGSAPDSVWKNQNNDYAPCQWVLLGTYYLVSGTDNSVSVVNDGTGTGYVIRADMMKFTNVPDFPVIYLPTNRHTFEDVPIDETRDWSFDIQNVGNVEMNIYNIINTNSDYFTLTAPTSFPTIVPALGSIEATVQFHPTEIGDFEARLRIATDAANYDTLSVFLDGNGVGNWVQVDDTDAIGFTMGHYEMGLPVVEDTTWQVSTSIYGINQTSLFTSLGSHPDAFCKWVPDVPVTANYDVFISTVPSQNSCNRVPYFINYSLGLQDMVQVDQNTTSSDNVWINLGRYEFVQGTLGFVEVIVDTAIIQPTPEDTVVVRADAIKLLEAPTGVALSTFFAEASEEQVTVRWAMTEEYHLSKFNLYRLTQVGAIPRPEDRINEKIIGGKSPYAFVDRQVLPGTTYFYWLEQIDETGTSTFHGPAIADLSGLVPATYQLSQNYPNPFNPETAIRYALPRDEKVTLAIFNIRGQRVKTLVDEPVRAGHHKILWRGRDEADRPVASGIYFVQMQAGDFRQIRKLALIK